MVSGVGSSSWTDFSSVQMRQEMFKKLDTDGDGKVSKTEFQAVAKKDSDGSGSIDDLFKQIDTDGDGSISEEENDTFLSSMEEKRKSGASGMPAPPSPEDMFKKLDTDGDGKVSKTEFSALARKDSADGPNTDDLFDQIDTDGDGSISEDENEAFAKKMEERMKNAVSPFAGYSADGTTSSQVTSGVVDSLA